MSLEKLCRLFGYSRQAYWKSWRRREGVALDESALVAEIRRIRRRMPRIGGRKLHVMLQAQGHDIGRDRLFALLRESGLRNRISRYRAVTTNSRHWMRKWPNLVAGQEIVRMNQVWVSDITYIDVYHRGKRHWLYLSLVTDACTHEILGWTVHCPVLKSLLFPIVITDTNISKTVTNLRRIVTSLSIMYRYLCRWIKNRRL